MRSRLGPARSPLLMLLAMPNSIATTATFSDTVFALDALVRAIERERLFAIGRADLPPPLTLVDHGLW